MMCAGARRLHEKKSTAAAWLLLFLSVLLVLATLHAMSSSRGDDKVELLRVEVEEAEPPAVGDTTAYPGSGGGRGGGERRRELRRLGSRPPCCERKCAGCAPCTAVQVRAGAGAGHGPLQCASSNYEPVGWKCKCGSTVFDP